MLILNKYWAALLFGDSSIALDISLFLIEHIESFELIN